MWSGCASTGPLLFGVNADSFSKEQKSPSESATSSSAASFSSSVLLNSTSSNSSSLEDFLNVAINSVIEEEPITQSSSAKRISEEKQVPRLIDNKKKHLKNFAAQRDNLQLQEVKEGVHYRKTLTKTYEFIRVFAESMQ